MRIQSQLWFGSLCLLALCGCGQGTAGSTQANSENGPQVQSPAEGSNTSRPLPTASISTASNQVPQEPLDGMEFEDDPLTDELDVEEVGDPIEGSPEWYLREITKVRFEAAPQSEDVAQLRQFRQERNDKIIEYAAEVIKQTHKDEDPKRQRLFEVAVYYMLEARQELALQGDKESMEALYDDAASLWERDRASKSAADAAFALVNLAYTQARQSTLTEHKWLDEFARQAQHFARNFSTEERRGLPMLHAAARSCELFGLTEQAVQCYSQLQESYPQSQQAGKVKGILRRLRLAGTSVRLGGPTLSGGHLTHEDLKGQIVLLVFWSAHAKPFLDELPILKEFDRAYRGQGLRIVGVCLDDNPTAVESFVQREKLDWPQIFYTESGKRGWNNPIATYYGIQEVGNWLIDSQGVVVSTAVKAADLEQQLSPLLKRGISRLPNPPR